MCLSTIKTEKEMKEWLKTQPEMIIAYKLVKRTPKLRTFLDAIFRRTKMRYSLSPMHYEASFEEFKKKNRIKEDRPFIYPITWDMRDHTNSSFSDEYFLPRFEKSYKAYFHLWTEIPGKVIEKLDIDFMMIKCRVPKYLITAVGTEKIIEKEIYVKGTDDPKKMGTKKREYKHIPTIVSKGFNIVNY